MTDTEAREKVARCIAQAAELIGTLSTDIARAERHEAYPRQHELLLAARDDLRQIRDGLHEVQRSFWPDG